MSDNGIIEQIIGAVSEETAYLQHDYPYGYHRTDRKVWIETGKKGNQRGCTMTLNPKTGVWNKPHKSTYSDIRVMGLDNIGHIVFDGFDIMDGVEKAIKFSEKYILDDEQKKTIDVAKRCGVNGRMGEY